MSTITPEDFVGVLRTYVDSTGRAQKAVDGPNGTYLITRSSDTAPYEVWKSDSLRTIIRTPHLATAIGRAMRAAGADL